MQTTVVYLPNWLCQNPNNREALFLDDDLCKTITVASEKELGNSKVLISKEDTNFISEADCGFVFGKLPKHYHATNKPIDICLPKVYNSIFTPEFRRLNQCYSIELRKVVFWYAIKGFRLKGGNNGNSFGLNQIATFLAEMPISFWEINQSLIK